MGSVCAYMSLRHLQYLGDTTRSSMAPSSLLLSSGVARFRVGFFISMALNSSLGFAKLRLVPSSRIDLGELGPYRITAR